MKRTIDEWYSDLTEMFTNSKYDVIYNGNHGGVAVVPKGSFSRKGVPGPQRICVYPKIKVGAGLVIEMDIYEKLHSRCSLPDIYRIKGNRPHYGDLNDEAIIILCTEFMKCF